MLRLAGAWGPCGRGFRESRGSAAQEAWREDEGAQEELRAAIRAVLFELFEKHNEIPFIAAYRKAVRARPPLSPTSVP